MMALRLGIEIAGAPRWFYGLSARDRLDVLAVRLPRLTQKRRPRHKGKALHKQVSGDADLSWLLDGDQ